MPTIWKPPSMTSQKTWSRDFHKAHSRSGGRSSSGDEARHDHMGLHRADLPMITVHCDMCGRRGKYRTMPAIGAARRDAEIGENVSSDERAMGLKFVVIWLIVGVLGLPSSFAASPRAAWATALPPASSPSIAAEQGEKPPEAAAPLPPDAVTAHRLVLADRTIGYTARAGTLSLTDDKGIKTAEIFYVAFLRDGSAKRPITFALNGGPAPLRPTSTCSRPDRASSISATGGDYRRRTATSPTIRIRGSTSPISSLLIRSGRATASPRVIRMRKSASSAYTRISTL